MSRESLVHPLGLLTTLWTIRLALACYVAYAATRLATLPGTNCPPPAAARWLWSLGCALFVMHVACAFHFHHGWSHAAAWETTAVETDALLGVRFGEGIYFSYLFLLVWVADVAWMWLRPARSGPSAAQWAIHAYLFFIALNGAIVFESGPTRWAGIAACIFLAGLATRAAYYALQPPAPNP